MEDVVNRPDDHATAAGISAAALRDDAGNGAAIGGHLRNFIGIIDESLLGPLAQRLGRVGLHHFVERRFRGGGLGGVGLDWCIFSFHV